MKPTVTVRCGTQSFLFYRLQTENAHHWHIYSWDQASPELCPRPDALVDILYARGAVYRERQDSYIEWRVRGCADNFRAYCQDAAWSIDSKEPNGARWHECDAWALELALGLRAPLSISNAA
jgi:hypothetical protein